jgi:protoporphyrinogen oxidase
MKAGFYQLIRILAGSIEKKGGRIISGNPARTIHFDSDRPCSVELQEGALQCDVVISTTSPMTLSKMIKPGILDLNLDQIHYQGTCCALLGLSVPLMKDGTYWLNINAEVPFGALIEHTNFMPVQDYAQEHLVYIASYFQDPEDTLYTADQEKVMERFIQGIESMFPDFDQSTVLWWKLTRDIQTAPVYETGYADTILPYCTNLKGLYLAGMFSEANYPERSMNDSIKAGYKAAEAVIHESDL